MIYLSSYDKGIIYHILSQYPVEFYAFGSRVKGAHHQYSDLDLCYFSKVPTNIIAEIKDLLSESNLTFTVDIIDFNQCDDSFKKIIMTDKVKLPSVTIKKLNTTFEWESYHKIRKEEIFSKFPGLVYDENHISIKGENHHHFILIVDGAIIGALDFELINNHKAILRILAVTKSYQGQGFGSILINFAHGKLRESNVYQIYVHSNVQAAEFYKMWGYTFTQFNDDATDRLPGDHVDMGRLL